MYQNPTTIPLDTAELQALIEIFMQITKQLIQTGREDAYIRNGMQNYIKMLTKQLSDAGITVEPYFDWKQDYPSPEKNQPGQ